MQYDHLKRLAEQKQWPELEREWLAAIEKPGPDPAGLLPVIDAVVAAGQGKLADTMGWAWLSMVKESRSPREALQLGRGLLLHLSDGNELRDEILTLYRQTHSNCPNLDAWVARSGLSTGKSVRRALRYLDTGVRLTKGAFLFHRSEDEAAEVVGFDLDADQVTIRTGRRTQSLPIDRLVDDYEIADEHDFRVLSRLNPERIGELMESDPVALVTGIVRGHNNQIDRDVLKLMLVPEFLPAKAWPDLWTRIRNAVKHSKHLRIEGRSPMMLIYDPVGQTPEEETWAAFCKADEPKQWLEMLENYLRTTKEQKLEPSALMLDRVRAALVGFIERFSKHREHEAAFATALIIERLAEDGLPISTDAHGMALDMLRKATDPVKLMAGLPDQRLWTLGASAVEQAFPDRWPELYAELVLYAPYGQCDTMAKAVEKAGRGDLLPSAVERALADPGKHTDALMWVWKGPAVKTELPMPKPIELFNIVIGLVGPARLSEGKVSGQTTLDMRAAVRSGLSAKDYGRFREFLEVLDESMAQPVRVQIERADGLGHTVRDKLLAILQEKFPKVLAQPVRQVAPWEDEAALYFTQAGLRAKESERDDIVNVKMRENAKAIGAAAEHGDLSENSEYKYALEERDMLRARLARVNKELEIAKILKAEDVPEDRVGIGHRVLLRPMAGGNTFDISISGHGEADLAKHVYSYKTPLAAKVLGRRVGDTITLSVDELEGQFRIEQLQNTLAE